MAETIIGKKQRLDAKANFSLRTRVVRAGSWVVAAHSGALSLRLISSLIFTRIFTPEVFGVLSIITVVQVIINLLTDIGLHQAIIQSPRGHQPIFLQTAWLIQIIRGAVIWSFGSLLALVLKLANELAIVPEDSVYAYPGLPSYIAISFFSAIVFGFLSMRWVIASRQLAIKRVLLIELFAQFISLVFVVTVGWATHSIWSYIFGSIVSSAIVVLLSHATLPGPADRASFDRSAVTELARFGRWSFFSSALSSLSMNGDRLLVSNWVNAQILGQYSVAYNLVTVPEGIANRIFGGVLFPALSEAARINPQSFSRTFIKIRCLTDAAIFFVAGLLFASGPTIVKILYDPRYIDAGWMLQWLSVSIVFLRYALNQQAYLALGKPQYLTLLSTIKLVSIYGLVPLLYFQFGLAGAIAGIATHMWPVALVSTFLNSRHRMNNLFLEITAVAFWLGGWLLGSGLSRAIYSLELLMPCR